MAPARRRRGGPGAAAAALLGPCLWRGAAARAFEQNCAARKLCNRPLSERDPALHEVPPELVGKAPKGHLRPIGHADFAGNWDGEIDVVEDMAPETFWTKYWPKKPFILRGFAKRSPAFEKWKDDDYILKHFGRFKAKCEPKNEDRLTDYCHQERFGQEIECGNDIIPYTETYMKIGKFLKHYRAPSFDKYIITQMPDDMGADFVVPNFHACARRHAEDPGPAKGGRWMTQMYENNFWLSYNGGQNFSSSVIHYDMNHQIMCQFSGTKEWFMWDLKQEGDKIPLWSGNYKRRSHTAMGSDDSPIDGERVDLMRWPEFVEARWRNGTLQPGDCLYTPSLLLHYVRSFGRNIAAMTMFQSDERYDPECSGEAVGEPKTLDQYDVMWNFPDQEGSLAHDIVKMGYPNWVRIYLWPLATAAAEAPGGKLEKKRFVKLLKGAAKKAGGVRGVEARAGKAFDSMVGGADAPSLFRSHELRALLKDIAITAEGGREEQPENTEVDRYDLQGDRRQRHLDL